MSAPANSHGADDNTSDSLHIFMFSHFVITHFYRVITKSRETHRLRQFVRINRFNTGRVSV